MNAKEIMLFIAWLWPPYAVALIFHYAEWLGWPTALVLGVYWIGINKAIADYVKEKKNEQNN